MMADGVHVVDGETFRQIAFIDTGVGAHGLYPSRDGKKLYVANRGSNEIRGKPGGPGSVSVLDFASGKVLQTWPIPGGGSPDMGSVSADGKYLWLSGRFDDVVYRIETTQGTVDKLKDGLLASGPHGLAAAGPLLARPHRQPAPAFPAATEVEPASRDSGPQRDDGRKGSAGRGGLHVPGLLSSKKKSGSNSRRNSPLARLPRNIAPSISTFHCISVRIARSCAGALRAATSAVRMRMPCAALVRQRRHAPAAAAGTAGGQARRLQWSRSCAGKASSPLAWKTRSASS